MSNLGGALARQGEYAAARKTLQQVLDAMQANEGEVFANTYYYLAEALLGERQNQAALQAAAHALAQKHQSPEHLAAAWRVLGQAAAALDVSIDVTTEDVTRRYSAAECFKASADIAAETGMEGERARTIRAWALSELACGDEARGAALWQEARAIFQRLGAAQEVARMGG
jgi:tetratricopeptide (TPR) repeat protein